MADVNPRYDAAVNPNYPNVGPWNGSLGQSAITRAWCGGAWIEEKQQLIIFGGGHGDYAGNETYGWDAMTGVFSRLSNPSGAVGNVGRLHDRREQTGVYFDGRVRSYHSYHRFAVRNGEAWFFGGSVFSSGNFYSRTWKWGGHDWLDMNKTPTLDGGSSCYDSLRDVIHLSAGERRYNPNTHVVTTTGVNGNVGQYSKEIYDPLRDCIVSLSDVVRVIKLNPHSPGVAPPVSGAYPPAKENPYALGTFYRGYCGFVYDAPNDRYLASGNDNSLYVLTPPPPGEDPATGTWTWSPLPVSEANVVTPSAADGNGTYGRFWISNKLGCCGVFNTTYEQMYVFALE